MKTSDVKLIGRSPLRLGFTLLIFALAWIALSPHALAVHPPPDGGYQNDNTANGSITLAFNTIGADNMANGWGALQCKATGKENTGRPLDAPSSIQSFPVGLAPWGMAFDGANI